MATVRWTERAFSDLQAAYQFVARDAPNAADALVARVVTAADRLARFPESGRPVADLPGSGYRELVVGSHRLLYRVIEDRVFVLALVHGRRRPEP